MRAIKRTVSVLLTLMLVLGMVTIAIGTASAAGTYKINVTSNIGKSTSKDYSASTQKVTITFNIKAPNLIGTRGLVTYDPDVLELADTTETKIFPNLNAGLVANTTKNGRIPFSAYNLNGFYVFNNPKTYVKLTFNVKNCTKDTTVNLDILDLIGSKTIPNKDEADEINYIDNGDIVDASAFTASVNEVVSPEVDPFVQSVAIALEGKIGMNFYLYDSPTGYTASNVKVKFAGPSTDNNKTVSLTSLTSITKNGIKLRQYRYYVAAAEMRDTITLTFYNGSTQVSTSTYTVADWVDQNVARYETNNPKGATLLKTMLNYGAAAQVQFGHNTSNLANKNSSYALATISASQISVPSGLDNSVLISRCGLEFVKSTAALESGTDIRLKCNIINATTAASATVTVDGTVLPQVDDKDKGLRTITLSGIPASQLDTTYYFKFSNGAQYKQSVMNYLKSYLDSHSTNSNIVNLVSSIYWYNQAANNFFGD